jgi:hypothetical protein
MSGYAPAQRRTPLPMTSDDISAMFGKAPGWFDRHKVRQRLYARGFPHPFDRGLWSATAVAIWYDTAGSNPGALPPKPKRERRTPPAPGRSASNGYAPV